MRGSERSERKAWRREREVEKMTTNITHNLDHLRTIHNDPYLNILEETYI